MAKADEAGLVIASNKRLGKALVGSNEWRGICDVFGCWTGTMTAYEKPDQKLGKSIEYTDSDTGVRYVFPVPEEQQGRKNVILVAEHPDFSLVKDGNDRVVQAAEISIVEKFPVPMQGWFLGDPKYDIPQGEKVDGSNKNARYLWRMDKRVGLVARVLCCGCFRRDVVICGAPSGALGAAVESPEGGGARLRNGKSSSGMPAGDSNESNIKSDTEIARLLCDVRPESVEAIRMLVSILREAKEAEK